MRDWLHKNLRCRTKRNRKTKNLGHKNLAKSAAITASKTKTYIKKLKQKLGK